MSLSKYELNNEQCNRVLNQAHKIPIPQIFGDHFNKILEREAASICSNVPFLLMPLLSVSGLLLQQSTVQSAGNRKCGFSTFSMLVAHPSTGKSPAAEHILESFTRVEDALKLEIDKSHLTQPATVETLLDSLGRNPCLLAIYDEAITMLGALGRYSGGGSNAQYFDRSVYNALFSSPLHYLRVTKEKILKIKFPRYHLCLLAHPFLIINLLYNERGSYDDGLLQRFLLLAPLPPLNKAASMRNCGPVVVALHCLFYFIYILHSNKARNYTFTTEAQEMLEVIFDSTRECTLLMNQIDPFFSATLGKSLLLIVRMAAILKSLEFASNILTGVADVSEPTITPEFMRNASRIANSVNGDAFIIDADILFRAKKFVDTLNLTKLVLASYSVNPVGTFEDAYLKIVNKKRMAVTVDMEFLSLNKTIFGKMKKVFEFDFSQISAGSFPKGNTTVHEANEVFQNLDELQLGRQQVLTHPGNHLRVNYFFRIKSYDLLANKTAGQNLMRMGLDFDRVLNVLKTTEEKEDKEEINQNNKRNRPHPHHDDLDIHNEPANKLQKISAASNNMPVNVNKENGLPYVSQNKKSPRSPLKNHNQKTDQPRLTRTSTLDENATGSNATQSQDISCIQLNEQNLSSQFQIDQPNHDLLGIQTTGISSKPPTQNSDSNKNDENFLITQISQNDENIRSIHNSQNGDSLPVLTITDAHGSNSTSQASSENNPSSNDLHIQTEQVNGKVKYFIIVDGKKQTVSKNGKKLGARARSNDHTVVSNNSTLQVPSTHGMITRRNSQSDSESSSSQPAHAATSSRTVNSIRQKNFNPLSVNNNEQATGNISISANGWSF